jgi:hypothetical protein
MYACSPKWDSDWITEEDLGTILSQLAPYIEQAPYGPDSIGLSHGLHFTGGEPFLNFELLCEVGYFSKCHFCLDIRKHLIMVDSFEELAPRQFYKILEIDHNHKILGGNNV